MEYNILRGCLHDLADQNGVNLQDSDVYDHWVNPWVSGNGGIVYAGGSTLHGLPASATVTTPANGLLVFTRG